MSNYTVYISSTNDSLFKDEANKSGLVNALLDKWYNHKGIKTPVKPSQSPSKPSLAGEPHIVLDGEQTL